MQVVSVRVAAAGSFFAVPLAGRIHEGVKFTNRDQRTLPRKCCDLLETVRLGQPFYLVADAYYACATVAHRLLGSGFFSCSPRANSRCSRSCTFTFSKKQSTTASAWYRPKRSRQNCPSYRAWFSARATAS